MADELPTPDQIIQEFVQYIQTGLTQFDPVTQHKFQYLAMHQPVLLMQYLLVTTLTHKINYENFKAAQVLWQTPPAGQG